MTAAAAAMPSSHNRRKTLATSNPTSSSSKYDPTRRRIEQMEVEREERRREMILRKEDRKERSAKLQAAGNPGDVDFIGMVEEWRYQQRQQQSRNETGGELHHAPKSSKIIVAVRKRPMSDKERKKRDHDSVTCFQPKVWIHSAKFKVDGITKYLTHTPFQFDHAFGEESTTDQIYVATTMPLLDHILETNKRGTIFTYGQTGSGKTFTLNGIQRILAYDLFAELDERGMNVEVTLAFFELYSGFVQDLLHGRTRCKLLEDGKGEVNVTGLQVVTVSTPEEFLRVIEVGHSQRTTHATEANDTSSRSHAICQVFLREPVSSKSSRKREPQLMGKLTLVDLAGSERGSDTKSHNSQRRTESAEINTSLLSLKECIRALGQKNAHVPYRGSKLTLILKDCFSKDSKTTMIATVSPGASATDHSLNTCRYADRLKEQKVRRFEWTGCCISRFVCSPMVYALKQTLILQTSTTTGLSRGGNAKSSAGPKANVALSQQRFARISAAFDEAKNSHHGHVEAEQPDRAQDLLASQNKALSPTGLVESTPLYMTESVSTFSGGVSDNCDDGDDANLLQEEKAQRSNLEATQELTMEEEAEIRRSFRETGKGLVSLEAGITSQHFESIQVSRRNKASPLFKLPPLTCLTKNILFVI